MGSALEQFLSSELSRNSAAVFAAAETAPVLITRRDGDDLVLMAKKEADAHQHLLEIAAQIVAVTSSDQGTLVERMVMAFPWMLVLCDEDKASCTHDIVRSVQAALATGNQKPALIKIIAWKETAYAVANGLGDKPVEWIEDEPVEDKALAAG